MPDRLAHRASRVARVADQGMSKLPSQSTSHPCSMPGRGRPRAQRRPEAFSRRCDGLPVAAAICRVDVQPGERLTCPRPDKGLLCLPELSGCSARPHQGQVDRYRRAASPICSTMRASRRFAGAAFGLCRRAASATRRRRNCCVKPASASKGLRGRTLDWRVPPPLSASLNRQQPQERLGSAATSKWHCRSARDTICRAKQGMQKAMTMRTFCAMAVRFWLVGDSPRLTSAWFGFSQTAASVAGDAWRQARDGGARDT